MRPAPTAPPAARVLAPTAAGAPPAITSIRGRRISAVLDGGPLIAQRKFVVDTNDEQVLKQRVHQLEYDLYWRVVDQVAAGKVKMQGDGVFRSDSVLGVQEVNH